MGQTYNIYCDESCHLENDHQKAMVLGAVWCPVESVRNITRRIGDIKSNHALKKNFEIKWTKVSPSKLKFYLNLVDYFFDEKDLHFRALIIPDKSKLDHTVHLQTHDEWYYKMYFDMLKVIISPEDHYRIYLDIKDTLGAAKVTKLHDVLSNNMYDFSRTIVDRIQLVRSHEVAILQIADILIGAVSYLSRGLSDSSAKVTLIERIKDRSHYSLQRTTLYRENKFNLFFWQAKEVREL